MRAEQLIEWPSRGGAALLLGLTTAMTPMASCTPHGQCDGMDYFIYTAHSSSPRLFHEDRGRARFFAHPPDAGSVLYQYDGASLEALGTLPEEPLARASLQGTSVVLTRGGLWRLTASDGFEVLNRFDAPLPDAQCSPKTDVLVEFGDRLVFVGPGAGGAAQLWVYHSTTNTIEVVEVPRRSASSGPCSDITQATVVGERMVFSAGSQAYRPWGMPSTSWWSYDGSELEELLPGPYGGYETESVLWQGHLWLRVLTFTRMPDGGIPYGASLGHGLAVYDGGVEPPVMVSSLELSPVGAIGDTLVLLHREPRQLWTYDASGLSVAVSDLEWCGWPRRFTAVDDRLYFTCSIEQFSGRSDFGRGLVAYDVSRRRVDVLLRQGVNSPNGGPSELLPWGGLLLHAGEDVRQAITTSAQVFRGTGIEPWAYDVASGTAKRIEDLNPGFAQGCSDL